MEGSLIAKRPGVFLLEGWWEPELTSTTSVLPLITFLAGMGVISSVAHRYVDTRDGLLDATRRWRYKKHRNLSIAYFGFHGTPGHLHVGKDSVDLETIGEVLEGRCEGRTLYFGSCSVLAGRQAGYDLLRRTGAKAVIGYAKDVDWTTSSAFDILLMEALTDYDYLGAARTHLIKTHKTFTDDLGLSFLLPGD